MAKARGWGGVGVLLGGRLVSGGQVLGKRGGVVGESREGELHNSAASRIKQIHFRKKPECS